MSFSPFLPSAPNTTPAVAASGRRAQRAPIYNPYDKFTAPEFDAWIGDITSALRRALGHETEEPEQDRPEVTSASASTERDASDPRDVAGTEAADTDEGSEEESFVVEDSFAHIASRRAKAKAKGKGRDPREGPGLGDGRRDQPIEILSDSGSQSDGSDEDEDEEVEESLNGDGRWHRQRAAHLADEHEGQYYEEEGTQEEEEEEEEEDEDEEEEEDEEEIWKRAGGSRSQKYVEYVDDDDEDEDGEKEVVVEVRNAESDEEDDAQEDEEESVFPPPRHRRILPLPEIVDPWEGPRTYAEDFYSGGDLPVVAADGLTPNHLTPAVQSPAHLDGDALNEDFSITPGVLSEDEEAESIRFDSLLPAESPESPAHAVIDVDLDGVDADEDDEADELRGDHSSMHAEPAALPDIAVQPVPPSPSRVDEDRELTPSPASRDLVAATPSTPPRSPNKFLATPGRPMKPRTPALRTPLANPQGSDDDADWDWNNPPAFNGRPADRAGHLVSDFYDDNILTNGISEDEKEADIQVDQDGEDDGEDEDDTGDVWGTMPLGTSDLDVPDWGRNADGDANSDVDIEENDADANSQAIEVDQDVPTPQQILQFTDEDSFGELPASTSPSPPRPGANPYIIQRDAIEKLFADLERQDTDSTSILESFVAADAFTSADLGEASSPLRSRRSWVSEELEGLDEGSADSIIQGNIAELSFAATANFSEVNDAAASADADALYFVEETHEWLDGTLLDDSAIDVASAAASEVEMLGVTDAQQYLVEDPDVDAQAIETLAFEEREIVIETVQSTPAPQPATELPVEGPVPAPVTADPNVPDPASPHMRSTSPAPVADSSFLAPMSDKLPALPPSIFKAFALDSPKKKTGLGGGSGLFTPVGGVEDGTPTPSEGSESGIAEEVVAEELRQGAADVATSPLAEEIHSATDDTAVPSEGQPTSASSKELLEDSIAASDAPVDLSLGGDLDQMVVADVPEEATEPDVSGKEPVVEVEEAVLMVEEPKSELEELAAVAEEPAIESERELSVTDGFAVGEGPVAVDEPAAADEPAPSTVDIEESPADNATASPEEDKLDDLNLEYPTSLPESEVLLDMDDEEDADGEVDPDYSPTEITDDTDPFRLMGSDSKVAPGAVENDEPSSSEDVTPAVEEAPPVLEEEVPLVEATTPTTPELERPVEHPVATTEDGSSHEQKADSTIASTPSTASGREEQSPEPERSLKRKRTLPDVSMPPRLTRSKSTITANASKRTATARKGKGKQDDVSDTETVADEPEPVERKTKLRLQAPASRAQSVASTATSSVQSPTTHHPNQAKLPPLMHSHSDNFIHHHHGRPAAPPAAVPPPITQPKAPVKLRSTSAEIPPTPVSSQPAAPRRLPNVNSPVTRSNCRFHKISLPREEGGPRVSFVVPGCSLGDGELMEDEEIEDHGFATMEDYNRMVPDIESLDFNSYLIGVLRQVVGVDLLREQEIFYLPTPGEEVANKKERRKSAADKLRLSHRQSKTSAELRSLTADSPRLSEGSRRSATPSVMGDQRSRGDSGSVDGSLARLKNGKAKSGAASNYSESVGVASEIDEDDGPNVKRRKVSPDTNDDNASVAASASPSAPLSAVDKSVSSLKPAKLRRSKRRGLHIDAAAYKPEDDAEDEEAEPDVTAKEKRPNGGRRKRGRTSTMDEIPSGIPKPKKSRLRKSMSTPAGQNTNGAEQSE